MEETTCLRDMNLFSEPIPIEEGIAPLVVKLRDLSCHILASCEGHSAHERGVLHTSAPYVLFVPEPGTAPLICSIASKKVWGKLDFAWTIRSFTHDQFGIAYRIGPIRFDSTIEKKAPSGVAYKVLKALSWRRARKLLWPSVRTSINNDIKKICRMLPAGGEGSA